LSRPSSRGASETAPWKSRSRPPAPIVRARCTLSSTSVFAGGSAIAAPIQSCTNRASIGFPSAVVTSSAIIDTNPYSSGQKNTFRKRGRLETTCAWMTPRNPWPPRRLACLDFNRNVIIRRSEGCDYRPLTAHQPAVRGVLGRKRTLTTLGCTIGFQPFFLAGSAESAKASKSALKVSGSTWARPLMSSCIPISQNESSSSSWV